MATRWMKWNESTHIFEYSTDGVTFNPLPLDASILTQGTIDPARLPAGIPSGGGNNLWTGVNTIVNNEPVLRFTESDAAADLKNWEISVDAGLLRVRQANDAWSAFFDQFTLNRNGTLQLNHTAGATHKIECSGNASVGLTIRANNAGAAASSQLALGNDAAATAAVLRQHSTGFVDAEPDFSNGLSIKGTGSGGVSIVATYPTQGIKFYTGGVTTKRLYLTAAGNAEFAGTISERGRATPIGEWVNIAYAAGNFTASAGGWTVESGDQIRYSYMLIGKSMFLVFDIRTSSVITSTPQFLRIALPAGFTISDRIYGLCTIVNAGAAEAVGNVIAEPGVSYIQIGRLDNAVWALSTNTTRVWGHALVQIT